MSQLDATRQDIDDLAEVQDMEHEAMKQQGEDAIAMNSPTQEVVEANPEPEPGGIA